ncbi:MAG: hypothetical protein A6D92_13245 [Symbiobacterium thermophilum]|uniref:Aconitate hydratase A n=1 Tax=Symbiobacterium thermophilum TaxID=2734 RepID=A0A1Y2T354_SYMTR|nr:MAG: hypothetical protein A6D92_13245 [Symbiobacterium thermophilum]
MLQGVKAVIAESFERIHRSNLIGMGVLPLQFQEGENAASLGLDGTEEYTITGISGELTPRQTFAVTARKADGREIRFTSPPASTPPSRSSTTRTAACCRRCCGASRRRSRRGLQ